MVSKVCTSAIKCTLKILKYVHAYVLVLMYILGPIPVDYTTVLNDVDIINNYVLLLKFYMECI